MRDIGSGHVSSLALDWTSDNIMPDLPIDPTYLSSRETQEARVLYPQTVVVVPGRLYQPS